MRRGSFTLQEGSHPAWNLSILGPSPKSEHSFSLLVSWTPLLLGKVCSLHHNTEFHDDSYGQEEPPLKAPLWEIVLEALSGGSSRCLSATSLIAEVQCTLRCSDLPDRGTVNNMLGKVMVGRHDTKHFACFISICSNNLINWVPL